MENKFSYFLNNKIRIDFLLKNIFPSFSRTKIQKIIQTDGIFINNIHILKPNHIIRKFCTILIPDKFKNFNTKNEFLIRKDINLKILFENENLIIINKPKNLSIHKGAGQVEETLVDILKKNNIKLSNILNEERNGIVHRLDKDTTGIMIIAKNDISHTHLSSMFKNKEINRKYIALCHGTPKPLSGKIINYIKRDNKNIEQMIITDNNDIKGKIAITNYKTLKIIDDKSIVECSLETGRTHQIRLHMLSINTPVVGDKIYRKKNIKNNNFQTQCLHSYFISFIEPITKEKIEIKNFDIDDQNFLKILNIHEDSLV